MDACMQPLTWSPVASASTDRNSPAASAWCRARRASSLSSARAPACALSFLPIMSAHDLRGHGQHGMRVMHVASCTDSPLQ